MLRHCHLVSRPAKDAPSGVLKTIGIKLVNPDIGGGASVLSAFGNNFGSDDARLGHAVDWGQTPGIRAAWAANLVNTSEAPFIGVKPERGRCLPLSSARMRLEPNLLCNSLVPTTDWLYIPKS